MPYALCTSGTSCYWERLYILLLHNKFVVALLVEVLIPQDNYKLIYPLADYIFTAGLVEGLGELISWETARAR